MTDIYHELSVVERNKISTDAEIRRIEQHITHYKNEISKLQASADNEATILPKDSSPYRTLAQLERTREKLKKESAALEKEIASLKERLLVR